MLKPDYKDGSIVNLMSSISKHFGYKSKYNTIKILRASSFKGIKNIVLIIIDGMGFEFLKKNGENTIFAKYLVGPITSVFPSTTATAITTFLTGLPAQQHAVTGWFMFLKEIGIVSKILPFASRAGDLDLNKFIDIKKIFNQKCFSDKIKVSSFVIQKKEIIDSDYTLATSGKSKRLSYNSLDGFFRQIKKAVKSSNKQKYIYAYWPEFDSLSHDYGINSKKTEKHFKKLDRKLKKFLKGIEGTNSLIIITSDHGFIDTTKKRTIILKQHPKLEECLTLPLCGEPRAVFCYVHPSKKKQFEKYVKTKLKNICYVYKSEDFIKKNYFGLFKPNRRLFDRIGDYILILKDNYVLKDNILGEKKHFHIGAHGGVSKEEMIVPLIVIKK